MTSLSVFSPRSGESMVILDQVRKGIFYALLIFWAILSIAPLYFTLVFSLKPVANAYTPPIWWPFPFTLENYQTILQTFELFPRWVMNSVVISITVTIFRVLFCAMAGYAFARIEFPLKNFLFNLLLVSMMMPGVVTLIPSFLIIGPGLIRGGISLGNLTLPTGFNLLDSMWGVIVPGMADAFGVFMMTQFYKSFPKELEEAAMMDGSGRWGTFFRIVLPISQTQLLTLGLLTFQGAWNSFMWPLLVLRTPENFTLPIGLQWFRGEYYTLYSVVLAGSLFNTLPMLIIFFAFQKYFIRSIASTGSKEG
ncbi:MAG: carbohydrate ABC transporter permease [Anaerolineales bacterium]|nr:carbohydrate ABC transporter permease [Anaerolineales bacterium]MCX7756077.1 carbohydrate ABC transporter permease [Anaerolineales bacterium]MDW8278524.1 carbohydrate ABC transporter permease [Anaerolineales bacterium]